MTLSYIEHFGILAPVVTGCISVSAFTYLVGIPLGITSSAIGLKTCAITAGLKKYKSIIKKKKKKHAKILFLAKTNLNGMQVLISMTGFNWLIYYSQWIFLVNNVLKEYYDMIKEIKNLKT